MDGDDLSTTHMSLSKMVRRQSVTESLQSLEDRGAILVKPGQVTVVNRAGLESVAGERRQEAGLLAAFEHSLLEGSQRNAEKAGVFGFGHAIAVRPFRASRRGRRALAAFCRALPPLGLLTTRLPSSDKAQAPSTLVGRAK